MNPIQAPNAKKCPHCDPVHESPARCAWGVRVAPDRDGDGQPTHLIVQPTDGAHVAEEDAQWLWHLMYNWRSMSGTAVAVVVAVADLRKLHVMARAAQDLVSRFGFVGGRSILRPLIDAVGALDGVVVPPVSATQPSEQAFEGRDKGAGADEDLRASQAAESCGPVSLGDALRTIATAGGPLRFATPSVADENQTLRELCVKRWDKIEKLRGRLYDSRIGAKNLRKLLKAERSEVKRMATLVAVLDSVDPGSEERDAAEHAIATRWPSLADSEQIAQIALDAAWYVFRRRLGQPDFDFRTTEQLHRDCAHPGWEYATTNGTREQTAAETPMEGDNWERNTDRSGGFDDFRDESYWRRPKPDETTSTEILEAAAVSYGAAHRAARGTQVDK